MTLSSLSKSSPHYHRKPRSTKKQKQQKLFVAMGTVSGLRGYLLNTLSAVEETCIDPEYTRELSHALNTFQDALDSTYAQIQTQMKNL